MPPDSLSDADPHQSASQPDLLLHVGQVGGQCLLVDRHLRGPEAELTAVQAGRQLGGLKWPLECVGLQQQTEAAALRSGSSGSSAGPHMLYVIRILT